MPDQDIFLSVLTIGEIAKGIGLMPVSKKKNALIQWLDGLQTEFAARVLLVDSSTAKLWGDLTARLQKSGIAIPAIDGLIAATAIRHDMHLMTHNSRHFDATGAVILDPWR